MTEYTRASPSGQTLYWAKLNIRKEPIREPVNPWKKDKEDTITDVEKASLKKNASIFLT